MDACPSASCGTDCPPGPFPKITSISLPISNTSSPVCSLGLTRWSALPLKCLPYFLKAWVLLRNQRCDRYTFFLQLPKYILSVSYEQCVHALYPLFVCPEMLVRAGQSLMVTNINAHRSNSCCLCLSHTRTPGLAHSYKSLSTNSLRYTSMLLSGCFGPWMSTGIIMNFRFMHN
jgi:hypothetical protein